MANFGDVDARLLKIAATLRNNKIMRTSEGIIAEKRVDVFKGIFSPKSAGAFATKALIQKKIADEEDSAHQTLQQLLDAGILLRVVPINNSRFLQPDLNRQWDDSAFFAWIYEGTQLMTILGAIGLLILAFSLVMYPLWPRSLRNISWYVMILLTFLIVLLLLVSVIRLIVFAITFFAYRPGIWIFPNLYEDVSFIESFIPAWEWHKPASD